jgi:glycerate kinase
MELMNILVATNAFKNSLDAETAASAIMEGLNQSCLACTVSCFPVGDGGDGTGRLILRRMDGLQKSYSVRDPLGKKISAPIAWISNHQTAVIELADASGLRLMGPGAYDPVHATTHGTGELFLRALDSGAKKILLCIGGSATTDGAAGLLESLGVRFLDGGGRPLTGMPESLTQLEDIDLGSIDPRLKHTEIVVLCDVANRLLGPHGTASIFAPQKGANPSQVKKLELCLSRMREIVLRKTGVDMNAPKSGGAAGGVAAGMFALSGAKLVDGIEYFLDLTGFDQALAQCDILITGEGSLDLQTLEGKAPMGVAQRAKLKSIPVIALAGKVSPGAMEALHLYFNAVFSIQPGPVDLPEALQHTAPDLSRTAREIGDLISVIQRSK